MSSLLVFRQSVQADFIDRLVQPRSEVFAYTRSGVHNDLGNLVLGHVRILFFLSSPLRLGTFA